MTRSILFLLSWMSFGFSAYAQVPSYVVSLTYQMEGLKPVLSITLQSTQNTAIKQPSKIAFSLTVTDMVSNELEKKYWKLSDVTYEDYNYAYSFPMSISPVLSDSAVVLVSVYDSLLGTGASGKISVPNPLPDKHLTLFNRSMNDYIHYAREFDTLIAKSSSKKEIGVYRFKNDFQPSLPPMVEILPKQAGSLFPESFWFQPCDEPFVLGQQALYFFQSDTLGTAGLGLLGVPKGFPKYQKVEDLIGPIAYITTTDEYRAISTSALPKSAFDNFWVNTMGSTDKVGLLIKLYYKRVTEANQRFTSYKEGWKTDRGMIHIVFGEPTRIVQSEKGEKWFYENLPSKEQMVFEFVKRPTMFSGNHMDLVRKVAYKKSWSDQVSNWRMGLVQLE